jgi:hypothetical protein
MAVLSRRGYDFGGYAYGVASKLLTKRTLNAQSQMNYSPRLTAILLAGMLSISANAQEPPQCDDIRILAYIRDDQLMMEDEVQLGLMLSIDPSEQGIVDYVPSLDSPKNRKAFKGYPWGRSRFCIANLQFSSGQSDVVHYRIDAMKHQIEGLRTSNDALFSMSPCFESVLKYFQKDHPEKLSCKKYQMPSIKDELEFS